jgi:hypothetical protein
MRKNVRLIPVLILTLTLGFLAIGCSSARSIEVEPQIATDIVVDLGTQFSKTIAQIRPIGAKAGLVNCYYEIIENGQSPSGVQLLSTWDFSWNQMPIFALERTVDPVLSMSAVRRVIPAGQDSEFKNRLYFFFGNDTFHDATGKAIGLTPTGLSFVSAEPVSLFVEVPSVPQVYSDGRHVLCYVLERDSSVVSGFPKSIVRTRITPGKGERLLEVTFRGALGS